MQNLINITDTAFLGRVGEVELGASALAGVYYLAIYMIGFGFSTGAQILMSRRNGEHDYKEIGGIMTQSCAFLLLLATVMYVLTVLFSPFVLSKLISSRVVYESAMQYMDWRIYGLFFSLMSVMFRAFFVGTTQTKVLTLNAVVMVLSNAMLNYGLIFGKFGFPQMGIAGAAIASVVAEAISVLFFAIYMWRKVDTSKYAFLEFARYKRKQLYQVFNISIWIMIQNFFTIGTWFLFFVAVEHLGERSLAVSNIVRSISTIMFMPVTAFATTASTLVGNAMGAGRSEQVIPICKKVIGLCFLALIPIWLITYLAPELLLRIYTDNQSLLSNSIPSLFVLASCYIFAVPAAVLFNAVSGTGNTRSALGIELLMLIFYISYIWIVIIDMKADVMYSWGSEHIYWGVMLLFTYIYLKKAKWQLKKI
jgi:putative MATE family efflux protein